MLDGIDPFEAYKNECPYAGTKYRNLSHGAKRERNKWLTSPRGLDILRMMDHVRNEGRRKRLRVDEALGADAVIARLKMKIPFEGIPYKRLNHEQRYARQMWWRSKAGQKLLMLTKGVKEGKPYPETKDPWFHKDESRLKAKISIFAEKKKRVL